MKKLPIQTALFRFRPSVQPQGVFAITLALLALLILPAQGANVFLKAPDAIGYTSVTGATNWSNGAVPSNANTYFTTNASGVGFQMRTPTGLSSNVFAGNGLVLCTNLAGDSLLIKGDQGSTIVVSNLIMAGGSVANGAGATSTTNTLAGLISVVANSKFNAGGAGRAIVVLAAITNGTSSITCTNLGAIWIQGTNNLFTGQLAVIGGCTLRITNQFNLGGNPSTFTANQLYLDNGTFQVTNSISLNDPNRGVTLSTNGGKFDVASGATLTLPNAITGIGSLTKLSPGTLVLSGANSYTNGTVLSAGILSVQNSTGLGTNGTVNQASGNRNSTIQLQGNISLPSAVNFITSNDGTVAPLTNAFENISGNNTIGGPIVLTSGGGGTVIQSDSGALVVAGNITIAAAQTSRGIVLQGVSTAANAVSGNVSDLSPTSIDSVTKNGTGTWALSGTNTYTGATTINGGTLALSGSGSISNSPVISIAASSIFDVSGLASTFVLGSVQSISNSIGTVNGSMATAAGSSIYPATVGVAGTLTYNNNLNMSAGGTALFDVSTTYNSGNDQIVVAGNLTLSSSDTIHINALGGASPLDQTADYILFAVSGTTTMTTTPNLVWDGTQPANTANFSIKKSGNNVVLSYAAATAPTVTSATATPNPAYHNQQVTVTANVTRGSGTLSSVTVDLSQIGGSSTAGLVLNGASSSDPNFVYTNTFVIPPTVALGNKSLIVLASDNTLPTPLTGSFTITPFTVAADPLVWNGGAADDKWASGLNWAGGVGPGYIGDNVSFDTVNRLTPDMDTNYTVTSVTFNPGAGAFVLGSSTGNTLTNTAGITNNSASTETVNVPVVISAGQTFNAVSGNLALNTNIIIGGNTLTVDGTANTAVGGVISGTAGLTKNGSGTLTLSAVNQFTGTVTLNNGTIALANTMAISNAARINVPANSTGTVAVQTDGGDSVVKLGLGTGSTTINVVSDRATPGAGISHPLSVLAGNGIGGGTINFTAGPNVTSGTANVTFDNFGMGAGSVQTTILSPTSATVTITNASKFNNNFAQTLQLDGTTAGNAIVGTIANGASTVSLIKANSSTWALSGSNTFTGTVAINGGTLVVNAPIGALGVNGTISFGGGILQYGPGVVANYSPRFSTAASQLYNIDVNGNNVPYNTALISSGGSLTLADTAGGGSLTLTGTNTYNGSTAVNGGKLLFSSVSTEASPITVASGAVLGVFLTAAGNQWTNFADVTLNAGSEVDIDSVSFAPSTTAAPLVVNGNFNVSATTTVRVKGAANFFTVGQSYPLITWTLSGPADASAFALIMPYRSTGHLTNLNNTLSVVVDSYSGPISWNTGNGTWNTLMPNWVDALNATATFVDSNDAVLFDSASGVTGNPVINLTNMLSPSAVVVNSASHNYTISGSGAIMGTASLTLQNGTLTDATANTYTGGTTVSGGTLQISGNGTIGSGGALTVTGGTLDLAGTGQTIGTGLLTSGALQNGTLTNDSTFTVSNATPMALNVTLVGAGGLTKMGNSTLTLTNINSFAGNVFVDAGTMVVDNGGVVNTPSYCSIAKMNTDVGILTLKGTGAFTNSNDFNVGDIGSSVGTLNIQDSASLSVARLYIGSANAAGSTASGTVNQTGGSVVQTDGGTGTFAVGGRTATTGVGVYNMSGGSLTSAGGVRVGGTGVGTFNVSGSAVINAIGGINISRIAGATGTLNLNGGTVNTLNITSSTGVNCTNNFNGATVKPTTANTWITSLTWCNVRNGGAILDTAGFNVSVPQVLSHSVIAGDNAVDGGLTKNGLGTLNLTGANTYTGNTTVNGGTLEVGQATIATNSTVSIAVSARLQLDFVVTNQIGALVLNGVTQAAGVYNSNNIPAYIIGPGSLLVPVTGPGGPGYITNSISGSMLTLTWPAGQSWRLVSQTNSVNTGLNPSPSAWGTVPGVSDGSATITLDPAKPTVFYKLVYP